MRLINVFAVIAAGVLETACAPQPTVAPTPEPSPRPTVSTPSIPSNPTVGTPPTTNTAPQSMSPSATHGGPWHFTYVAGTYHYTIATTADVTSLPDSTTRRSLPEITRHITVAVANDGSVQLIDPTPHNTNGGGCDSVTALMTRVSTLFPSIPSDLTAGAVWSDSTEADGCRGVVPLQSKIARTYVVSGDTTYEGNPALLIKRSETVTGTGEGSEGQHRIITSIAGTGTTDLYFDPRAGRFLGSLSTQTTTLIVSTSGRTKRFVQHVTERISPN